MEEEWRSVFFTQSETQGPVHSVHFPCLYFSKIKPSLCPKKKNPASCSRSDEKLYALPLPVLLPFLSPYAPTYVLFATAATLCQK